MHANNQLVCTYQYAVFKKRNREGTGSAPNKKIAYVTPVEAFLRVVEELGRLHEDVAHVVAQHDQRADTDQTVRDGGQKKTNKER